MASSTGSFARGSWGCVDWRWSILWHLWTIRFKHQPCVFQCYSCILRFLQTQKKMYCSEVLVDDFRTSCNKRQEPCMYTGGEEISECRWKNFPLPLEIRVVLFNYKIVLLNDMVITSVHENHKTICNLVTIKCLESWRLSSWRHLWSTIFESKNIWRKSGTLAADRCRTLIFQIDVFM